MRIQRSTKIETLEQRAVLNAAPALVSHVDGDVRVAGSFGMSHEPNITGFEDAEPQLVADFTSDGIDDVLVQWPNGKWGLQINDGTQLFLLPWGLGPDGDAQIVDVADFNNDGLTDVLSFDRATGDLWVSINSTSDGFVSEIWANFLPTTNWLEMFVDDFDGDGWVDVLGGESGGGWWLAKNVQTTFHNYNWGRFANVAWQDVLSADFTGDGLPDVAARAADNTWWLWEGDGAQLRPAAYWGHWKMRDHWHDVSAEDFNSDGRADLIGRSEDGRIWVGSATTDNFHTWTWGTGWIHGAEWTNVNIVDMNSDGLPDQLGRANDSTWWYAENTGDRFLNHYWQQGGDDIDSVVSMDFVRSSSIDVTDTMLGTVSAQHLEVDVSMEDSPVKVSVNDENRLVVSGFDVELFGLDFKSPGGSLVLTPVVPALAASPRKEFGQEITDLEFIDPSAAPFQFFLKLTPTQVTFGSLATSVVLNGSLALNVGWSFGEADLAVDWGGPIDSGPADVDDLLDGGVDRIQQRDRPQESNVSVYYNDVDFSQRL